MNGFFNNKKLVIALGLLIGLATLFSHSFRVEIRKETKAGTEQSEKSSQAIIVSPSAAVTVNAFSFQPEGFLQLAPMYEPIQSTVKAVPVFVQRTSAYFQTLFRFIIAPNAP